MRRKRERTVGTVRKAEEEEDGDGTDSHRNASVYLCFGVEEPEVLTVHEEDDASSDRVKRDQTGEGHLRVLRSVSTGLCRTIARLESGGRRRAEDGTYSAHTEGKDEETYGEKGKISSVRSQ